MNQHESYGGIGGIVAEKFASDPEVISALTEAEKQQAIFDSATAEDIEKVIGDPEKKGRFMKNLEKLQSKLKKLEKYWPAIVTAGIAITALIASFATDSHGESSRMQISDGLAAISAGFGMVTLIIHTYLKEGEKGKTSGTPQHA